ncbi:hypothetical protein PPERSA_11617 [Pseudocohnilembus persalinus]|uniref:Uncharacterized protein n=1 Tax=Pseudocohnilembus persalinus TaxID=266149 RepID=A0A0V0Q9X0_PSEPJ|nr:hypothetical protein PPERSA_11617 [Pseudocohnilembus persalinus]|eukprot:KRW99016.1 hypothetical protein PPERSA_11617 [Pseudocohnilembus persalinus]
MEMKNTYLQQLESLQKWQIDQSQETDSLKQLIKQNFGLQNNHNNNKKNIQYGNYQQSPYLNEDAQTEFLDLRQTIQDLQTFVSELKQQVLNLKIEKQEILTSSAIEKIKLESQKEVKQEIEKEQIEFEKAKKKLHIQQKLLADQRVDLDKKLEDMNLLLLEKEGQIKVLKEKIYSYEREKKNSIDHAQLLCSVSEKLMTVLNKMEK